MSTTIEYEDPSLLATPSDNGMMSAADKRRLDGLDGYASISALNAEISRAEAAELQLQNSLNAVSLTIDGYATITALSSETSRAIIAEQQILNALDGYGKPPSLDGYATTIELNAEIARAEAAEQEIRSALDGYQRVLPMYMPLVSGFQTLGSTYTLIGGLPAIDYSSFGIKTMTLATLVHCPALSTVQVRVYDKTNSAILFESSAVSGLVVDYDMGTGSTFSVPTGPCLIEFWQATPTSTGGNSSCVAAGLLLSYE